MSEAPTELCGKCEAEIVFSRRVDFTTINADGGPGPTIMRVGATERASTRALQSTTRPIRDAIFSGRAA